MFDYGNPQQRKVRKTGEKTEQTLLKIKRKKICENHARNPFSKPDLKFCDSVFMRAKKKRIRVREKSV